MSTSPDTAGSQKHQPQLADRQVAPPHFKGSLDAVILIDAAGRVTEFNSVAESTFGFGRGRTAGRDFVNLLVPRRLHRQVSAGIARCRTACESGLLGGSLEALVVYGNGSEVPVRITVTSMALSGELLLRIRSSDALARKNAGRLLGQYQVRLQSLAAELLLTEERERRRLAIDLHDGLGQTIALLQMKLVALRGSAGAALESPLKEIEGLIEQANRSTRSIAFDLSPPVLHDLGLEPAVEWLVEDLRARYGLEVELEDDGQPKPADESIRIILFRSIRELLINAAKHANADRVQLSLHRENGSVCAAVEDDGVGMQADPLAVEGTGLLSIRERLSHVGGTMLIESSPGQGTKVYLRAPLTSKLSTKTEKGR